MTADTQKPDGQADEQTLMPGEPFALAAALFEGCRVVAAYIAGHVRPLLPMEVLRDDLSRVLFGQFLRAEAWLRTIIKLDTPSDFQAVAAACRSLFETTIDMVLLTSDPAYLPRLIDWEELMRLKHINAIKNYYGSNKNILPTEAHRIAIKIATERQSEIRELCKKHGWINKNSKPFYPDRWTQNKLDQDAREADKSGHSFRFEHFYETQYREICWSVHGSGFIHRGVSPEDFPGLAGLLFPSCADLCTLCAEIAIRHILGWSDSFEKDFEKLRTNRNLAEGFRRREVLGLPLIPNE